MLNLVSNIHTRFTRERCPQRTPPFPSISLLLIFQSITYFYLTLQKLTHEFSLVKVSVNNCIVYNFRAAGRCSECVCVCAGECVGVGVLQHTRRIAARGEWS